MVATTTTPLLTADEFILLPQPEDGTKQELVKGVIVTMPPASFYHGQVCSKMDRKLGNFVEEHNLGWTTSNDSGVIVERGPDTVRGPDVAFWSKERLPDPPRKGYPSVVPDLVVEVLSPSDVFTRVHRKVTEYHNAGVRVVWILVPEDRSVAVFRPDKQARLLFNGDKLDGEDVLPGFGCSISELFP